MNYKMGLYSIIYAMYGNKASDENEYAPMLYDFYAVFNARAKK
jgi:hypothetical protein